ncbi:FtsH protease activity modulator HflK [Caulobacter sp. ErkDOM-YI]|uniref:FtsH protease activity modulator HflK n=1 Tax=unclassified Caulobacter TaxID=2648921 RepID=UPI003AF74E05
MPWNDNAGPGPWGSPPPNGDKDNTPRPGPRRPSGGPRDPQTPIDLNQVIEDLTARLRGYFQGPDRPRAIATAAGAVVALWAVTGVYVVQPNQQGVVSTFGAFSRVANPGLRYHLPFPVETVEKVSVSEIRTTDIGATGTDGGEERLMLTSDENIVDLAFSVQWRVSDAPKYLFNVRDPDSVIRAVGESAMREVVGKTALTPILTTGRGQLQLEAEVLMQQILDRYDAGVFVESVQIQTATPPPPVIDAFRDVQRASQNAQSAANVARGRSAEIVQQAKGYREQVVREAAGEAARFNQIYDQYKLAPAVTRERLYLETMQRVLANSNKVIIDSKGASAPVILPPDAFRPRTATVVKSIDGAAQ